MQTVLINLMCGLRKYLIGEWSIRKDVLKVYRVERVGRFGMVAVWAEVVDYLDDWKVI